MRSGGLVKVLVSFVDCGTWDCFCKFWQLFPALVLGLLGCWGCDDAAVLSTVSAPLKSLIQMMFP